MRTTPAAFVITVSLLLAASVPAQTKSFTTPKEAAQAFVHAIEMNDLAALKDLFGSEEKGLIESGDAVQDRNQRAAFAGKARHGMKLQIDPEHPSWIFILTGEEEDPFAIPLPQEPIGGGSTR